RERSRRPGGRGGGAPPGTPPLRSDPEEAAPARRPTRAGRWPRRERWGAVAPGRADVLPGRPPVDDVLGTAVPLGMGLVALGGLGLAGLRSLLLARLVAHETTADDDLQARAGYLAA